MSGAAIAGAAVVGAGASYMSAKSASKSSSAATAAASEAAQMQNEASLAQLEFQKQQYSDWENIFGPIQENLSSYYKSMKPETLSAIGIQNIEKSYNQSKKALDTGLAQRGLTGSGQQAAALTQLETSKMLAKAEVRTNAPQQVAQQQLGFLSAGLGLQSNLQQGISGAYTNQMNALGNQASNSLAQASNYGQQAAAGYAGIGSSIGSGISTYMTANAYQSQANLNNAMANSLGNSTNYSTSPSSYGATSSWWQ